MQFFHGTIKSVEESILTTSIKPSEFSIDDYLTHLIKIAASTPPKSYEKDGKQIQTKWLGTGVYLFDAFNKDEAINWRTRYGIPKAKVSDCTAIRVEVNEIEDDALFDLFSYSGRNELKKVLSEKFKRVLIQREDLDREQLLPLIGLRQKIMESLDNLFDNEPYLGGVAIDLYNLIENGKIKLVRGIYKKGNSEHYYDVYYCLKDGSLIKGLNPM